MNAKTDSPKPPDDSAANEVDVQCLVRLEAELSKAHATISQLQEEWRKYRLALNRIAHPTTYGMNKGHEREIARRALVIGMTVEPLPKGAISETKRGLRIIDTTKP